MIYLKIKEDQTIEYPYSINQLKDDYPNTSFPQNITNGLLLEYNVYIVIEVSKDNDYTKNYTEGTPILVDGQYYQNWIITNATTEEIEYRINGQWSIIRIQRNQYLSECDWTQLSDSPLTSEKKEEWVTYRQELRDVTLQVDPFNIVFPSKPD
jgi:hypothetical protein